MDKEAILRTNYRTQLVSAPCAHSYWGCNVTRSQPCQVAPNLRYPLEAVAQSNSGYSEGSCEDGWVGGWMDG